MNVLYVATGNAGKLRDFAAAAATGTRAGSDPGPAFSILPLPGLSLLAAPEETEPTFEGNARMKAEYYSRHADGALVLADDSGLEVDALGGAPGVYSARYAERAGDGAASTGGSKDERNNAHLLAELARALTPAGLMANLDHRRARYRCVLAAARDGVCLAVSEGSVAGVILLAPRGVGGFGYDPLFLLPSLGQTMAELDTVTRLGLSHRGEALRELLPDIPALLATPGQGITMPRRTKLDAGSPRNE